MKEIGAASAYYSHNLDISMKTSSGDVIDFSFENKKSSSMAYKKDQNTQSAFSSFSSMQSFQFSISTNGIDAQDKKEIEQFMKKAQPYIDKFLQEFETDAPNSPVNKIAHDVASIFEPSKLRDADQKNFIKTNIVEMFDKSLQKLQLPKKEELSQEDIIKKILEQSQQLLKKVLQEFDDVNKKIYA